MHAAKARRGLALRNRQQKRKFVRARDDRDVLLLERLAIGLAKRRAAIDPQGFMCCHCELAQIVKGLRAKPVRQSTADTRIVAADTRGRESWVGQDPHGAIRARRFDPRGNLAGFKRVMHERPPRSSVRHDQIELDTH